MYQPDVRPAAELGQAAIAIKHGTFGWEVGGPNILNRIDLDVQSGKLVIVVGEVTILSAPLLLNSGAMIRSAPEHNRQQLFDRWAAARAVYCALCWVRCCHADPVK